MCDIALTSCLVAGPLHLCAPPVQHTSESDRSNSFTQSPLAQPVSEESGLLRTVTAEKKVCYFSIAQSSQGSMTCVNHNTYLVM